MIFRLALRYSFSLTSGHRRKSLRILVSTALSVAVLLIVISIMEYLQDTRLSAIRDVRSFDAVIEGDVADEMRKRFPGLSVFPYAESDALLDGEAMTVRFIDSSYDGGIMVEGDDSGLLVPYFLRGGAVDIMMLGKGRSGAVIPLSSAYVPTGRYSSRMGYEFDGFHVFLPLSLNTAAPVMTAVKGLDDDDAGALEDEGFSVTTWKEKEAGLYSALMIEKVMMYLVLSLLFLVILVSQRSAARTFYGAKRKERAELEVLGMGSGRISAAFTLSFLIILLLGLLSGTVLAFIATPVAEAMIRSFGFRSSELSMPYRTLFFLSLILIAFAVMISFSERRKEGRMELQEVLRNE